MQVLNNRNASINVETLCNDRKEIVKIQHLLAAQNAADSGREAYHSGSCPPFPLSSVPVSAVATADYVLSFTIRRTANFRTVFTVSSGRGGDGSSLSAGQ
jgi:hypothetical protein